MNWKLRRETTRRDCPRCGRWSTLAEWPRWANGRYQKHCGQCESPTAQKTRAHRLERKRASGARYRAKRRAIGITQPRAEPVVRVVWRAVHALAKRRVKATIHDGHVRAFRGMSSAERYRWRFANDPSFVINQRMRVAIKKALRGGKAGRRWESIVGYTLGELVARLEATMPEGHSVADFRGGALHIDHVVPKREFDVTDREQLRACWALSNLQTLTAAANMAKGARLDRSSVGQG